MPNPSDLIKRPWLPLIYAEQCWHDHLASSKRTPDRQAAIRFRLLILLPALVPLAAAWPMTETNLYTTALSLWLIMAIGTLHNTVLVAYIAGTLLCHSLGGRLYPFNLIDQDWSLSLWCMLSFALATLLAERSPIAIVGWGGRGLAAMSAVATLSSITGQPPSPPTLILALGLALWLASGGHDRQNWPRSAGQSGVDVSMPVLIAVMLAIAALLSALSSARYPWLIAFAALPLLAGMISSLTNRLPMLSVGLSVSHWVPALCLAFAAAHMDTAAIGPLSWPLP